MAESQGSAIAAGFHNEESGPRWWCFVAGIVAGTAALLLLMDTDKSGEISRQEYMSFMSAEFDRLDKDKSGELDVRELAQSQFRASRPAIGKQE